MNIQQANQLLDFIFEKLDNRVAKLEKIDKKNEANLQKLNKRVENIKDLMEITSITNTYKKSNEALSISYYLGAQNRYYNNSSKNIKLDLDLNNINKTGLIQGLSQAYEEYLDYNENLRNTIIKNLQSKKKKSKTKHKNSKKKALNNDSEFVASSIYLPYNPKTGFFQESTPQKKTKSSHYGYYTEVKPEYNEFENINHITSKTDRLSSTKRSSSPPPPYDHYHSPIHLKCKEDLIKDVKAYESYLSRIKRYGSVNKERSRPKLGNRCAVFGYEKQTYKKVIYKIVKDKTGKFQKEKSPVYLEKVKKAKNNAFFNVKSLESLPIKPLSKIAAKQRNKEQELMFILSESSNQFGMADMDDSPSKPDKMRVSSGSRGNNSREQRDRIHILDKLKIPVLARGKKKLRKAQVANIPPANDGKNNPNDDGNGDGDTNAAIITNIIDEEVDKIAAAPPNVDHEMENFDQYPIQEFYEDQRITPNKYDSLGKLSEKQDSREEIRSFDHENLLHSEIELNDVDEIKLYNDNDDEDDDDDDDDVIEFDAAEEEQPRQYIPDISESLKPRDDKDNAGLSDQLGLSDSLYYGIRDNPQYEIKDSLKCGRRNSPQSDISNSLQCDIGKSPHCSIRDSPELDDRENSQCGIRDTPQYDKADSPQGDKGDNPQCNKGDSPQGGIEGSLQDSKEDSLQCGKGDISTNNGYNGPVVKLDLGECVPSNEKHEMNDPVKVNAFGPELENRPKDIEETRIEIPKLKLEDEEMAAEGGNSRNKVVDLHLKEDVCLNDSPFQENPVKPDPNHDQLPLQASSNFLEDYPSNDQSLSEDKGQEKSFRKPIEEEKSLRKPIEKVVHDHAKQHSNPSKHHFDHSKQYSDHPIEHSDHLEPHSSHPKQHSGYPTQHSDNPTHDEDKHSEGQREEQEDRRYTKVNSKTLLDPIQDSNPCLSDIKPDPIDSAKPYQSSMIYESPDKILFQSQKHLTPPKPEFSSSRKLGFSRTNLQVNSPCKATTIREDEMNIGFDEKIEIKKKNMIMDSSPIKLSHMQKNLSTRFLCNPDDEMNPKKRIVVRINEEFSIGVENNEDDDHLI